MDYTTAKDSRGATNWALRVALSRRSISAIATRLRAVRRRVGSYFLSAISSVDVRGAGFSLLSIVRFQMTDGPRGDVIRRSDLVLGQTGTPLCLGTR